MAFMVVFRICLRDMECTGNSLDPLYWIAGDAIHPVLQIKGSGTETSCHQCFKHLLRHLWSPCHPHSPFDATIDLFPDFVVSRFKSIDSDKFGVRHYITTNGLPLHACACLRQ